MKEKSATCSSGILPFVVLLLLAIGGLVMMALGQIPAWLVALGFPILIVSFLLIVKGLFVVAPNQAKVLTFFGKYTGTVREPGFWFANPFASKSSISLKIGNFQSQQLKVNDAQGNPIEIACVIVWRVTDTAMAFFDVENYVSFLHVQCETALRHLASEFPYEPHSEGELSLRSSPEKVSETLKIELQQKVQMAGLEILGSQLSHLAYSPEIAQAMLRRQQANAVLAARQVIVEGAVGMVELALKRLEGDNIVTFDEKSKAAMVNNLMITLVSESHTQPVISTSNIQG